MLEAAKGPQASQGLGGVELLGIALLILAGALIWATLRRAPVVAFGITWMAVTLFPVANLVVPTGIVLAERTLFLPSVGFVLAA